MSSPRVLRILTWNLWHGLNPYQRLRMSPMERPEAHALRYRRQVEALRAWCQSASASGSSEVLCFQEVNPLAARFDELSEGLQREGGACFVNTGVKLAGRGFPPGLQEGLAILHAPAFRRTEFSQTTLSGSAFEVGITDRAPLFTFQTGERRRALLFEGELEGRRIAVINLHLHHGPDTAPANLKRKRDELERLKEWITPKLDSWDLAAVCGDFNCETDSACLEPLRSMGFEDSARLAGATQPPSWVPDENALVRESSRLAGGDSQARDWDGARHVFDRIYLKARVPLEKVELSQLREPELSDHYGVAARISLKSIT